ncbi:MAG: DUF1704 domain-containing protein [Gammaproteobacteria bacterium]|nr:DUF1704 domain-containing protein [Gammaproteobacteria bacterium]
MTLASRQLKIDTNDEIVYLKQVSERLAAALQDIKLLARLTPINESQERVLFDKSLNGNPSFEYLSLDYDSMALEQALNEIEIPDTELGSLLENQRKSVIRQNQIARYRGDVDRVKNLSQALYGEPGAQLVATAKQIIEKVSPEETLNTVSATEIKQAITDKIADYDLNWRVEFSDKLLTTVYPADRLLTVCEHRNFAEIDLKRLPVHEVGVHVLRAANGYLQPLKMFAVGFSKYLSTEEGMAAYFEEQTGTSSTNVIRSYAARVLAADSMCRGDSFRQTFDLMSELRLSNDDAWNTTVRIYRGGGFAKDYIYLLGMENVRAFADSGGDLRELYVGKIGIEDLEMVRTLRQQGVLVPPKYLPEFLS